MRFKHDQIRDVEIAPIGRTGSREEDVRDAVADFQAAVAGESVIEGDPAKGESFRGAGTLEIFIQRSLRQHVGARPAITGHDEGRQVIFITELVDHVEIDQRELRRCGRDSRTGRGGVRVIVGVRVGVRVGVGVRVRGGGNGEGWCAVYVVCAVGVRVIVGVRVMRCTRGCPGRRRVTRVTV